ncbi:hypothetical protein L3X38_031526 [Prunus dulcis]|uniref:RNA 3'-terminal phosphate cyclase domain-containing protein n=1 Tax=Prunus dulcis TaxID=3755 RepID=A0AAD4VC95_PRUDU|nr:hypothetical protein L3X38_031526 [Prunus dulcis]
MDALPKGGGEVVVAIPVVQSLGYVHIFTDHRAGPQAGDYISHARGEHISEVDYEKKELVPPKDVGLKIASVLLGEIGQGGVVDSNHQGLFFLLCALCPQDVSKVRVGKLFPYGIDTLRNINDFLGVKFVIMPCASTSTVLLKCVGCGLRKLSRKIS